MLYIRTANPHTNIEKQHKKGHKKETFLIDMDTEDNKIEWTTKMERIEDGGGVTSIGMYL